MHPAVVLLLGCATAAAQDSLAVCDLNTDLPESLGTVNLKFSESVMVHNNLGGKGGKDTHNGKPICYNWNKNACQDPCPNGRNHQRARCLDNSHRAIDCKSDPVKGKGKGKGKGKNKK